MKVPFAGKKVRVTSSCYPEFQCVGYVVPGPCPDWAFSQVPTHHLYVTHSIHRGISWGRFNRHEPIFTTDRIEVIQ